MAVWSFRTFAHSMEDRARTQEEETAERVNILGGFGGKEETRL